MIDVSVIKQLEGKKVNLVLDSGGRCTVYSNIVYKSLPTGHIEFVDNKLNVPCFICCSCIQQINVVA